MLTKEDRHLRRKAASDARARAHSRPRKTKLERVEDALRIWGRKRRNASVAGRTAEVQRADRVLLDLRGLRFDLEVAQEEVSG